MESAGIALTSAGRASAQLDGWQGVRAWKGLKLAGRASEPAGGVSEPVFGPKVEVRKKNKKE